MNWDFDAAIFDMDGTLLDTMRYWRFTTLEYLLAHQMPVRGEDLARMLQTSSRRFVYEIAEREGLTIGSREAVVREMEGYMHRHYLYDARVIDGVPALLQALRARGVRMCVATGAPREFARDGLTRLGLIDYFEFVTDHYEFGMTKSEPEYFRVVAERLGTTPDRCAVFEDALYSMRAAKAAGCTVVAREEETALLHREEIKAIADVYIREYSELLQ